MADDDQDSWLGGLGVDLSSIRQSIGNAVGLGGDDNSNQSDSNTTAVPVSANTSGGGTDTPPQSPAATSFNLTLPQLTIPGAQPPSAAGDPPQLKIGLSPDEVASCESYLAAHRFAAVQSASGDYQPSLDGNPVSVADVVQALLPLTAAGSANAPPADQSQVLIQQATAALLDFVQQHVRQASVAGGVPGISPSPALPAQPVPQANTSSAMYRQGYHEGLAGLPGQCREDATPDETRDYEQGFSDGKAERDGFVGQARAALRAANQAAKDAGKPADPAWKQWRDAVKDWCEKHGVDTGPMLDSLQDLFNLPDDGTKLPPSQHGQSDPHPPTQDDN